MFPDHFNFIESLFLFRINIMEHFLDFISFNYDKVGALNFFERNYIPDIISVFYNLDMDAESERICNFFQVINFYLRIIVLRIFLYIGQKLQNF